jgi:hypothetical protein
MPIVWMAPFFSGGGYCSEAISYVTALARNESRLQLGIVQVHYNAVIDDR